MAAHTAELKYVCFLLTLIFDMFTECSAAPALSMLSPWYNNTVKYEYRMLQINPNWCPVVNKKQESQSIYWGCCSFLMSDFELRDCLCVSQVSDSRLWRIRPHHWKLCFTQKVGALFSQLNHMFNHGYGSGLIFLIVLLFWCVCTVHANAKDK